MVESARNAYKAWRYLHEKMYSATSVNIYGIVHMCRAIERCLSEFKGTYTVYRGHQYRRHSRPGDELRVEEPIPVACPVEAERSEPVLAPDRLYRLSIPLLVLLTSLIVFLPGAGIAGVESQGRSIIP